MLCSLDQPEFKSTYYVQFKTADNVQFEPVDNV